MQKMEIPLAPSPKKSKVPVIEPESYYDEPYPDYLAASIVEVKQSPPKKIPEPEYIQ